MHLSSPPQSSAYQAAASNQVDTLQHMHSAGCKFDTTTLEYAVVNNQLAALQYLHSVGCQCDEYTLALAALHNSLDCLKYLVESGCKVTYLAVRYAATKGMVNCLAYLVYQVDFQLTPTTVQVLFTEPSAYSIDWNLRDTRKLLFKLLLTHTQLQTSWLSGLILDKMQELWMIERQVKLTLQPLMPRDLIKYGWMWV